MPRKLLPIALAAATLVACASQPRAPAPVTAPVVSMPAPTEELDWLFAVDGSEGVLSYGTPHSDDLRLGLRCRKGAPTLNLILIAGEEDPHAITLQAGGVTRAFPARAEEEPMTGGLLLTARVRKDDPVIQAFRRDGWIALVGPGDADGYAPQAGTTAVEAFFQWCA